jgi:hypothetical protein
MDGDNLMVALLRWKDIVIIRLGELETLAVMAELTMEDFGIEEQEDSCNERV